MLVPTVVYAAVALRWAIDQFQREDVLFREAERFSVSSWLRHLFRDREPMPTGGQATLCFVLILTSSWFLMQYLAFQEQALTLASVAAGQFLIAIPPLFMAVLLTSAPARTLRLTWPDPRYLFLALALAIALNPLVNELRPIVEWLFPISTTIKASLNQLIGQVELVAHNASLLAESARQAAGAAPPDDPAFAPLAANLKALDAEAKQMGAQLQVLASALQSAQNRIGESTSNLDRAAEDLRQAIDQFRLQSEAEA